MGINAKLMLERALENKNEKFNSKPKRSEAKKTDFIEI
ncbi:MAG: hypothetical protein ACI9FB_002445 [Candidatus Azotimanducaceae bacterium]|jgi:hypothetical protein